MNTLLRLGLSGLIARAKLPWGLARTLSRRFLCDPLLSARCDGSTLLELATGSAKHVTAPAFPVPGSVACITFYFLCPTVGSFPYRDKDARLAIFNGIAFTGLCRSTCYCLLPPSPRRSIVPLRRHKGPTKCRPVYLAGQGLVRYRN